VPVSIATAASSSIVLRRAGHKGGIAETARVNAGGAQKQLVEALYPSSGRASSGNMIGIPSRMG
jgi:hypothetical protein